MDVAKGVTESSIDISALADNLDLNLSWERVGDASVCTNPLRFKGLIQNKKLKEKNPYADSKNALVNLDPLEQMMLYKRLEEKKKTGFHLGLGTAKDIFAASLGDTAFAQNVTSKYSVYAGELMINRGEAIDVRRLQDVSLRPDITYDQLTCEEGGIIRDRLNEEFLGTSRKFGRDCKVSEIKQTGIVTKEGYFKDIKGVYLLDKDVAETPSELALEESTKIANIGYVLRLPHSNSKFPCQANVYGVECRVNGHLGIVYLSYFPLFSTYATLKSITAAAPWTRDDTKK